MENISDSISFLVKKKTKHTSIKRSIIFSYISKLICTNIEIYYNVCLGKLIVSSMNKYFDFEDVNMNPINNCIIIISAIFRLEVL